MIRDNAIVSLARQSALTGLAVAALLLSGAASAQTCDPATSALGAHLSHARPSFAHGALACSECHPPVCSANQTTPVAFGPLASSRGAQPTWDPATRTCSGVYCHGSTLRNPVGPIAWTYVDPAQARPNSQQCIICHGYPPSSHSASFTSCQGCHSPSVLSNGSVDVAGGHHIDGRLDFSGGGSGFGCDACHAFPPQDPAHLKHFGLTGAASTGSYGDLTVLQDRYPAESPTTAPAVYAFGCGNCHPLAAEGNDNKHMDGSIEVALYEAAAPAGSLKARNATAAAYDAATKTCSGVYCHSSGQAGPAFVTTPAWDSGQHLGCAGCHSNPPAYATGGAGTATANTHLLLRQPAAPDYQLYGHFTWHNRYAGSTTEVIGKHGVAGEGAAPMTCQACHSQTVDPSSTGPSGFYWLDTTGDYNLPGARLSYGCRSSGCHTGLPGEAPQAQGRVLPLRHVNGTRDVVFDARTEAPSYDGLPPAPFTPDFPYWIRVLVFKDANVLPSGAAWNPPPAPTGASSGTVSFRLDGAGYDTTTKTCSSVACHLKQASVQWGGTGLGTYSTCFDCHSNH